MYLALIQDMHHKPNDLIYLVSKRNQNQIMLNTQLRVVTVFVLISTLLHVLFSVIVNNNYLPLKRVL